MHLETVWGYSEGHHDASLVVLKDGELVYASHAERYSKQKNDPTIHPQQKEEALAIAGPPDRTFFYENPIRSNLRRLRQGQKLYYPNLLHKWGNHHLSHAAAGYYTSGFDEALVIVADAIGELETLAVYHAQGKYISDPLFTLDYPNSIGLFYSNVTERCGLKPNEDEYILMGMSAYGKNYMRELANEVLIDNIRLMNDHRRKSKVRYKGQDAYDAAYTAQTVTENYITNLATYFRNMTGCKNLVFGGGVALNCVLNTKLEQLFSKVHILFNPGDAGSALGAILQHTKQQVKVQPFLGTDIPRRPNPYLAVDFLTQGFIIGIATGRAEWGPRALGNRSILADPRTVAMKDAVNRIKQRQSFRPFAPVIFKSDYETYFEGNPDNKAYMQYAVKCKRPDLIPAVVHVDGTSRVQVLEDHNRTALGAILREWKLRTGCPVLLNTSLNVKGQPLVNTWHDSGKVPVRML